VDSHYLNNAYFASIQDGGMSPAFNLTLESVETGGFNIVLYALYYQSGSYAFVSDAYVFYVTYYGTNYAASITATDATRATVECEGAQTKPFGETIGFYCTFPSGTSVTWDVLVNA